MKYSVIKLILIYSIFLSVPQHTKRKNIIQLPLEKFQLYTFQLVKKAKPDKMIFVNGINKEIDDLIWEEPYLLYDKENKNAIYFTTFSHKYIFKGGVYNRAESDSLVFLDELEFVYFGRSNGDKIVIENTGNSEADDLEISFEFKGNDILFRNIKLDRFNSPVDLKILFSSEILFQKDTRQFAFGQKKIKLNYEYDYFEILENIYTDFNYLYGTMSCTQKEVRIKCISNKDELTFERFRETYANE